MKKTILVFGFALCLILSIAVVLNAGWWAVTISGSVPTTGGCDSCTGNLVFVWYCNSTTVGDTNYSPCGCSAGDTSATAVGSPTITDGYVEIDAAEEYYTFDVADIWNEAEGSILVEFEVTTWADFQRIITFRYDDNNYVTIRTVSSNDLMARWDGGGTIVDAQNSGSYVSTNTKYYAIIRWTKSDVDPNLACEIYNSSGTLLESTTNNTNLPDMTDLTGDQFQVGNLGTGNLTIKIYTVKIWNTYNGASI